MRAQLTLKNVLDKAIQREIKSQRLYSDLSQKMTDAAAKEAFRQLSREEFRHEELLRKYERGELGEGALGIDQVLDYRIAEHLEQPDISPHMQLKDVFLMAANHEQASHEFYLRLAAVHPTGQVKVLIEQLASQELSHKHRVEHLYTEVAFPQTDGG